MILFIQNISIEGPGTLGDFLTEKGQAFQTIDLYCGERLPADTAGLKAVVILGGPMNVYEEDKYPFLKDENIFIQKLLEQKIPYLGLCLGAQLLAKAAGAWVTQNPVPEIGFSEIELTSDGKKDLLFAGLPQRLTVFQWHGDTFGIPQNAKGLAQSTACRHQALRVGPTAYGLQFHVEVTDKDIGGWADAYLNKEDQGASAQKAALLRQYVKNKETFHRHAGTIYNNFLKLIPSPTGSSK